MTVHLISVGVSLLNVLQDQDTLARRKLSGKPDLVAAIGHAEPWDLLSRELGLEHPTRDEASKWLSAALEGGDLVKSARLREVAEAIRPREWPQDMGAELETFAVAAEKNAFSLKDGDIAIFVCSDTLAGLLAGVWNAVALTRGDLSRVCYIADPGALSGGLRGQAVLVRIAGMDAGDSKGFEEAMRGLGVLARQLSRRGS